MLLFAASPFREGQKVANMLKGFIDSGASVFDYLAPSIAALLAAAIVGYLSFLGYRKVRAALGKV